MKKIVIGVDTHKENEYITRIEAKKKRFEELLDYCQQFISRTNRTLKSTISSLNATTYSTISLSSEKIRTIITTAIKIKSNI